MVTLLAIALALSPSAQPAADTPALIPASSTRFAPSLESVQPYSMAAHPGARLAYAWSNPNLFIIDTATGELVATRGLSDVFGGGFAYSGTIEVVQGPETAWLVFGRVSQHDRIEVFSLDDPRDPIPHASIPVPSSSRSMMLPGGRSIAVIDYRSAFVTDLDTGSRTGEFQKAYGPYSNFGYASAAGGPPEEATIALVETNYIYGAPPAALTIHSVTPDNPPSLRAAVALERAPDQVLVDRGGTIVVLGYGNTGAPGSAHFEVRDAQTGDLLSQVPAADRWRIATLAEGGGRRVLAVAAVEGVALTDLADPASPAVIGLVETRMGFDYNGIVYAESLVPSATAPLLLVASPGEKAVLAVDIRDGSIAGRASTAGLPPLAIAVGEIGGSRDAVALAFRREFQKILALGGLQELQVLHLADPASPSLVARLARSEPRQVDAFVGLGPDHVVAVDSRTDSYALVDLRNGAVAQLTGPPVPLGAGSSIDPGEWLRSAGAFVLAVGSGTWQQWRLVDDRLAPVATGPDPYYYQYFSGDLHASGRAVLLGYGPEGTFLEVHDPDGRAGTLPLDLTEWDTVTISPTGRLALVVVRGFDPDTGLVRAIDLADLEHPKVAWAGEPDVATAEFSPSGSTILVTEGYFSGSFAVRRIDARTGAPIGGASAQIDKFYYHGIGTSFGTGASRRAVFWKWSYIGFETVLVDAGASTPTLLRTYPELVEGFPEYAPRATGGWYEIARNPWNDFADFLIADASGAQHHVLRDPRDHVFPRSLARGLFATVANPLGPTPEVVLWVDTTIPIPVTPSGPASSPRPLRRP